MRIAAAKATLYPSNSEDYGVKAMSGLADANSPVAELTGKRGTQSLSAKTEALQTPTSTTHTLSPEDHVARGRALRNKNSSHPARHVEEGGESFRTQSISCERPTVTGCRTLCRSAMVACCSHHSPSIVERPG